MAASSSKKASVPEAKEAMSRFKEEVASELGVPLKRATTVTLLLSRPVQSVARWSSR